MEAIHSFRIWIEAENWPADQWDVRDGNTDVIVTFTNKERWEATFVTYENVKTLTEKNRATGENLSGAYFWVSTMILIDEISRSRIENVIRDVLDSDDFRSLFCYLGKEDEFDI